MDIQVPLYRDSRTPEFFREAANDNNDAAAAAAGSYVDDVIEPDTNIHMDAMAFGMGMCCLVSVPIYIIHQLSTVTSGPCSDIMPFAYICVILASDISG